MSNGNTIPIDKMIPVTEARRNLGDLLDRLPKEKEFYLMRGGDVVAKLSFPLEKEIERRKKILHEVAGSWKGTDLDSDELWKDILVRERIRGTKKRRIRL